MIHQKLLVDDNYKQKTAKKRKFTVQSTCFDTIMSEKSRVSGKSSNFHILGQFFRVGTQKYSFSMEHCNHTETHFTMEPLYSTDTSPFELVCYDLLCFCSFPDLLALLRGSYPSRTSICSPASFKYSSTAQNMRMPYSDWISDLLHENIDIFVVHYDFWDCLITCHDSWCQIMSLFLFMMCLHPPEVIRIRNYKNQFGAQL